MKGDKIRVVNVTMTVTCRAGDAEEVKNRMFAWYACSMVPMVIPAKGEPHSSRPYPVRKWMRDKLCRPGWRRFNGC